MCIRDRIMNYDSFTYFVIGDVTFNTANQCVIFNGAIMDLRIDDAGFHAHTTKKGDFFVETSKSVKAGKFGVPNIVGQEVSDNFYQIPVLAEATLHN